MGAWTCIRLPEKDLCSKLLKVGTWAKHDWCSESHASSYGRRQTASNIVAVIDGAYMPARDLWRCTAFVVTAGTLHLHLHADTCASCANLSYLRAFRQ